MESVITSCHHVSSMYDHTASVESVPTSCHHVSSRYDHIMSVEGMMFVCSGHRPFRPCSCAAVLAERSILAEGAIALPVTLSGGVLFAS